MKDKPNTSNKNIQTTIRCFPHVLLQKGDLVRVLCDRSVQTVISITPATKNIDIYAILEFTSFQQIKEDCIRELDLPRKIHLHWKEEINMETDSERWKEDSIESDSNQTLEQQDLSNNNQQKDSIKTATGKNSREQSTQTDLTVRPHILDTDEVANVYSEISVQTSIAFAPNEPVDNILLLLKENLSHHADSSLVSTSPEISPEKIISPKSSPLTLETNSSLEYSSKTNILPAPSIMAATQGSSSQPTPSAILQKTAFEHVVAQFLNDAVAILHSELSKILEIYVNQENVPCHCTNQPQVLQSIPSIVKEQMGDSSQNTHFHIECECHPQEGGAAPPKIESRSSSSSFIPCNCSKSNSLVGAALPKIESRSSSSSFIPCNCSKSKSLVGAAPPTIESRSSSGSFIPCNCSKSNSLSERSSHEAHDRASTVKDSQNNQLNFINCDCSSEEGVAVAPNATASTYVSKQSVSVTHLISNKSRESDKTLKFEILLNQSIRDVDSESATNTIIIQTTISTPETHIKKLNVNSVASLPDPRSFIRLSVIHKNDPTTQTRTEEVPLNTVESFQGSTSYSRSEQKKSLNENCGCSKLSCSYGTQMTKQVQKSSGSNTEDRENTRCEQFTQTPIFVSGKDQDRYFDVQIKNRQHSLNVGFITDSEKSRKNIIVPLVTEEVATVRDMESNWKVVMTFSCDMERAGAVKENGTCVYEYDSSYDEPYMEELNTTAPIETEHVKLPSPILQTGNDKACICESTSEISWRNISLQEPGTYIIMNIHGKEALTEQEIPVKEKTVSLEQQDMLKEEETAAAKEQDMLEEEEEIAAVKDQVILDEEESVAAKEQEMLEGEETDAATEQEMLEEETAAANEQQMLEQEETAATNEQEMLQEEETAAANEKEMLEEETAAVNEQEMLKKEENAAVDEQEMLNEERTGAAEQHMSLTEEIVLEAEIDQLNKKVSVENESDAEPFHIRREKTLIFNSSHIIRHEPYMESLSRSFESSEEEDECGSHMEMPWKDIVLPRSCRIKTIKKIKPCICINADEAPLQKGLSNSVLNEAFGLEIELGFHETPSTPFFLNEGAASAQPSVSTVSTVSDMLMKPKRCEKELAIQIDMETRSIVSVGFQTKDSTFMNIPINGTPMHPSSSQSLIVSAKQHLNEKDSLVVSLKSSSKIQILDGTNPSTLISITEPRHSALRIRKSGEISNTSNHTGIIATALNGADDSKIIKCTCNNYTKPSLFKEDPVIAALKAYEAEMKPLRETLTKLQEKIRSLNLNLDELKSTVPTNSNQKPFIAERRIFPSNIQTMSTYPSGTTTKIKPFTPNNGIAGSSGIAGTRKYFEPPSFHRIPPPEVYGIAPNPIVPPFSRNYVPPSVLGHTVQCPHLRSDLSAPYPPDQSCDVNSGKKRANPRQFIVMPANNFGRNPFYGRQYPKERKPYLERNGNKRNSSYIPQCFSSSELSTSTDYSTDSDSEKSDAEDMYVCPFMKTLGAISSQNIQRKGINQKKSKQYVERCRPWKEAKKQTFRMGQAIRTSPENFFMHPTYRIDSNCQCHSSNSEVRVHHKPKS